MINIIMMIAGAILIVSGFILGVLEIIYDKNSSVRIEQELKNDYFN